MSSKDTYRVLQSLERLGIPYDDAQQLRRISLALHRWNERECNGEVERDEESGKTFAVYNTSGPGPIKRYPTADKERGAQKRLAAIMAKYPALLAYEQGDPRGCALYIIERDKLAGRDVHGFYSSVGVGVY